MAAGPTLGLSLTGTSLNGGEVGRLAERAERLGFDSIWSSEAWSSDALTPLAYIAACTTTIKIGSAIAQLAARSPGATAMTTLTLQQLSGGRFLLGLGVSGPQVVEGWHGVAFTKPLAATRDYLAIVRQALAGDAKVVHRGEIYQVPYEGEGSTGLGKPLRSTLPPAPDTPIFLAAIGPRNVALATEIADGLLPYLWSPTRWQQAWGDVLAAAPAGFQIAPTVLLAMGDDVARCRDEIRPRIGLHIGAMGSRRQNFYADLVARYGYEGEARHIQDLYLSGDRKGAIAAVPDALVDDLALVGPPDHIAGQLEAWRDGPPTTIIIEPTRADALERIAALW